LWSSLNGPSAPEGALIPIRPPRGPAPKGPPLPAGSLATRGQLRGRAARVAGTRRCRRLEGRAQGPTPTTQSRVRDPWRALLRSGARRSPPAGPHPVDGFSRSGTRRSRLAVRRPWTPSRGPKPEGSFSRSVARWVLSHGPEPEGPFPRSGTRGSVLAVMRLWSRHALEPEGPAALPAPVEVLPWVCGRWTSSRGPEPEGPFSRSVARGRLLAVRNPKVLSRGPSPGGRVPVVQHPVDTFPRSGTRRSLLAVQHPVDTFSRSGTRRSLLAVWRPVGGFARSETRRSLLAVHRPMDTFPWSSVP
jgi:hypothetical protein